MRNAFADEILKMARECPELVLVTADIGNRLFDQFKAEFPERFFNVGVAEALMTGVAAGLASQGLKAFTYTITPFATVRCLEQIKVDLCYHNLPVVVCGVGSGYSYGILGATHHACDDVSLLRTLPNMAVVCPGDPQEVRAAMRASLKWPSPMYLRLGKKGEPNIHPGLPDLRIGKALPLKSGTAACLFSTGTVLPLALEAGERLAAQGIALEVVSFPSVKPLDQEFLGQAAERFSVWITLEEHSLVGGLGSALAEWLVDRRVSNQLLRIAAPDEFIKDCGEQEYIQRNVGLSGDSITQRILGWINQPQEVVK